LKIITFLLLLDSYLLIEINYEETKDLFLPLIGFFGLSSLFIFSLNKIEQEINLLKLLSHSSIDLRKVLFFSFLGVLLSIPANVYPLTTPTHFLLFLSLFFEIGLYYSIVLVSSMSTADFILSLITKEYFGYSRNYVVSFSNFSFDFFNLFFILLFSLILLILIGLMITILTNILPRKVILIIVFLSIIWPFFLDLNIWKIFTLLISSFLGFLSLKFGIERINLFNGYLIWYLLNYYF
jgi:TctA family transporter